MDFCTQLPINTNYSTCHCDLNIIYFDVFIDQRLVDLWVLLWPAHQAISLRRYVRTLCL